MLNLLLITESAVTKSAGPPACYSGEPPLQNSCISCHSQFPLNTGPAEIFLDLGMAENGFVQGQEYEITLGLKKVGLQGGGFQFIALYEQNINQSAGTITLTDLSRTQLVDKDNPHAHNCTIGEKVWVEHTYNGIFASNGEIKWNFKWKAPQNSLYNRVNFYVSMVEADMDLTENGDKVYTLSKTILEINNSIHWIKNTNSCLFYDYAQQKLIFNSNEIETITLFDLQGRVVDKLINPIFDVYSMHLYNKGIYLLTIHKKNGLIDKFWIIK